MLENSILVSKVGFMKKVILSMALSLLAYLLRQQLLSLIVWC